jgi:hypothetical protein
MTMNLYSIVVTATVIASLFPLTSRADSHRFCTQHPPGIEGTRLDVANEVVLQRIKIDPNGRDGYIATEYIGSPNLQTSIYLKTSDGYCLIGDLGGATEVKVLPSKKKEILLPISVSSVDGPYKFTRMYIYKHGKYIRSNCFVKEEGKPKRRCTVSEE